MQITRFTDYSLRVLVFVAQLPPEELTQITAVAEALNISRNHLVKVVHQLGKSGWIKTYKGKGGGFCLGVAPKDVVIGAVVRKTEPNLKPIDCENPACPYRGRCKLETGLWQAQQAFLRTLDEMTLADLITKAD